eukprot:scaffold128_cov60-Phaeocystis_antarctica.AAC.5
MHRKIRSTTPAPPPSSAVDVVDEATPGLASSTQPSHWKEVCPPKLSFPPDVGPKGHAVGHWWAQKPAEQLEHDESVLCPTNCGVHSRSGCTFAQHEQLQSP